MAATPTISTFKEIITDARLLGPFVINTTAEARKRNTAAFREEQVLTRGLAASAEATLSKLDDGLHIVSAEIANIKAQEQPEVRNSEMASALTAGLDAIEKLSIKTVARTARKQSLQEVLDYGRTVVRIRRNKGQQHERNGATENDKGTGDRPDHADSAGTNRIQEERG